MVSKKRSSTINKGKTLSFSDDRENQTDNKIIVRRKSSARRVSNTPLINNKKFFRERKKDTLDNHKNWSWAHSIMLLTISIISSIIIYDVFISEFFSHSITLREKRDIYNKRLKNVRVRRAPIDYSYHCDDTNCQLPGCQCYNSNNPGGLETSDIPQFVLLSFNGPLTEKILESQEKIIEGIRTPKDCSIKITNFVTDTDTDFYELERAYVNNNEIANNLNVTPSSSNDNNSSRGRAITPKMVNSLRNYVEEFTPLKKEDIIGFRFKGNEKLKSNIYHDICELEYLYDSSFSTSPLTNIWPFTLDYGFPIEINPKLTVSGVYPGLWEIPIYELLNLNDTPFSISDSNNDFDDDDHLLKILQYNFLNFHYDLKRIPYTLSLSEEWLDQEKKIETLNKFLKWIVSETGNNTYFITYSQLIEWMKNPVGLSNINSSNLFQCEDNNNNRKMSCDNPNHCSYKAASFKTCKECPIQNPYLGINLDNIPQSSPGCDKVIPEDGCGYGIWECGCQCLNNDNNLDGYCLDEYGKCTIPKKYQEDIGYTCE